METGDLISWEYTHHYNSRSRAQIVRHGEYIRKVKHTNRYNGPQLAVVQFYKNEGTSRVPLVELRKRKNRREGLISAQKHIFETF